MHCHLQTIPVQFNYGDCDTLEAELDEFFSVTERAFLLQCKLDFDQLDRKFEKQLAKDLVNQTGGRGNIQTRLCSARILLYISLGTSAVAMLTV